MLCLTKRTTYKLMSEQRQQESDSGEGQVNEVGRVNMSMALPLSSAHVSRVYNRSPHTHDGLNVAQGIYKISRSVGHS